MNLLKRLFLWLFSPLLVFIFGDRYVSPAAPSLQLHLPRPSLPPDEPDLTGTIYTNRPNISQALLTEFEELSRIVDISYCVGYSGIHQPFKCLGRCHEFPSFQLVATWNTGPYLSDSCGYVALSHPPADKRLIVAFRGTYSLANAIADLSLNKQEYLPYPSGGRGRKGGQGPEDVPWEKKCEGCLVHSGFLESWTQAKKIVGHIIDDAVRTWVEERGYKLVLVGHSLGGAVAALAGLEYVNKGFHPVVTTFGEPRIGNVNLTRYLNARFTKDTFRRITHVDDPVPLLPLGQWGFRSHQTEFFVKKKDVPGVTERDVVMCEGDDDEECIAGGSVNVLQLFWAHRDYFHRLGVCLPDPRVVWAQDGKRK